MPRSLPPRTGQERKGALWEQRRKSSYLPSRRKTPAAERRGVRPGPAWKAAPAPPDTLHPEQVAALHTLRPVGAEAGIAHRGSPSKRGPEGNPAHSP